MSALLKQNFAYLHIPSVVEPQHLHRTYQIIDNLAFVQWAVGWRLMWDVKVVDSLAPSRISAGSVLNHGGGRAEDRKTDKKDV